MLGPKWVQQEIRHFRLLAANLVLRCIVTSCAAFVWRVWGAHFPIFRVRYCEGTAAKLLALAFELAFRGSITVFNMLHILKVASILA